MASIKRIEFGDFQTPEMLAREVCRVTRRFVASPRSILEPSCGTGVFVASALKEFTEAESALGVDINEQYLDQARQTLTGSQLIDRVRLLHADIFRTVWEEHLSALPEPILVIGNPPWVTSATIGRIEGANLPAKSGRPGMQGLDAVTGKSNFDVAEWLLLRLAAALTGRNAAFAVLCKTSVARRFLSSSWAIGPAIYGAKMFRIDTRKHFGASVDACLLICDLSPRHGATPDCEVIDSLAENATRSRFGFRDNHLVSDPALYESFSYLRGTSQLRWRSGVKHDCRDVMEASQENGQWTNGLGALVDIESEQFLPVLNATDIARGRIRPERRMVVPQRVVGQQTSELRLSAPRTWEYLVAHSDRLDARRSSIYRDKPRFSVFGVGEYTFAPWKIAVSGLHPDLAFRVLSPSNGSPIVLDDTCYMLGFATQESAEFVHSLLVSQPAVSFLRSQIFSDSKRPVTAELLNSLSLLTLATTLGVGEEFKTVVERPLEVSVDGQLTFLERRRRPNDRTG